MSPRLGLVLMLVGLLIYTVALGQRIIVLFFSHEPVAIAIAIALVLLPPLAVWGVWRELAFGFAAEKLGKQLADEGALPEEEVRVRPSGAVVRADADELFQRYRSAVENDPEQWRTWYRLGLVYSAAGDRSRARSAIRTAIRIFRSAEA